MTTDNRKKAAAAATVAAVISASGAAVDATFDDPAEILQQTNPEPKIEYAYGATDEDVPAQEDEKKAPEKKTAKEAFRDWILELPLMVRVLFVLPQWFIGHLVIAGGEFLFAGLSPILHGVLSFVLMALVIAAAFTVTAKAMFPDLPLGKILNRHTIKWILIGSAGAFGANLVLGVFWADYAKFKLLAMAGLTLICLGSLAIWFARRENARRKRQALESRSEVEIIEEEEPKELVYSSLGETFTVRPREEE